MLLDPRMIGRAVDREVERELEAVGVRRLDQAVEVIERAELGMERVVAAVRAADRVRAAGIVGGRRQRVVAALAVLPADRVDRGEVEHVEPHALDVGQAADHVVEGAVAGGIAARRAREHLVPGGELGGRPVDRDLELVAVARGVGAHARAPHQRAHVLAEHDLEQAALVLLERRKLAEQRLQRLLVRALGLLMRLLDQLAALDQLERDVEAGVVLLLHLVAPAREQVAPSLDRVEVAGVAGDRKLAGPAVVVDQRHGRLAPALLVLRAVLDRRGDLVVAVAEDVGLDRDDVAHHALDRMAAAVELGRHALDHHARGGERQQPLLARLRRGFGGHLGRLEGARLAAEHAQLQGLERERLAGLEGQGGCLGRDVLEVADPAAGVAQQRPRIEPPGARRIGVDEHDRGILRRRQIAAREAQEADHRAVGRGDLALRALAVERGAIGAHAVDRADEAREVDARLGALPLPVAWPARDHVEARAAAVLEAHRHQHAAREAGGEQVAQAVVALELGGRRVAELDREALACRGSRGTRWSAPPGDRGRTARAARASGSPTIWRC